MAYVGNIPAEAYISLSSQTFTTINGTGYTLSSEVTNSEDIALFLNDVRQKPSTYTATGTTLTMGTATTTADAMYCVYLGKGIQTVNPPAASVNTAEIADGAVTNAKVDASAAVAYSKLNLTDSIVNADINSSAAIATSKITGLAASATTDTTDASNIGSGTLPDGRFPATLPTASGANLTNLNATNLATGSVATARLASTGTASATTFLRGDQAWAEAGGGKVLQVVEVSTEGQQSTTSTSYGAVSGMTLDITPSATSSKILLLHSANVQTAAGHYGWFTIYRDSTDISVSATTQGLGSNYSSSGIQATAMAFSKLDSPNTTSQITYTVQFRSHNGTAVYYGEPQNSTTTLIAIEIGA